MPDRDQAPALRVLIVDDESLARDAIKHALAGDASIEVVGECSTGRQAIDEIRRLGPDLVFLDIQMPGGGGFDVVETIGPEHMPPVIFVTAYDAHALKAFDVHAVDYLLKPFDRERFAEALRRARGHLASRQALASQERLAALLHELRGAPASRYLTRLTVREDERVFFVNAADVDRFESAGNYVKVYTAGREHRVRASLKELLDQLDPRRFRRIHRSTIVNLDRIREVQPWFGGDYVLIQHDGTKLRVSRTYASELLRPMQ